MFSFLTQQSYIDKAKFEKTTTKGHKTQADGFLNHFDLKPPSFYQLGFSEIQIAEMKYTAICKS